MRSSPPSRRHLLPAYRSLVPNTIVRGRRQVQRVRDEKFPAVTAPPTSSVPPPWSRTPLCVVGHRYSEYEMRSSPPSLRRLLPAYRPLVPSTILRGRRQVQRVRDEKYACRFYCKVKHPVVNLERQVRRHRTADSPRLFLWGMGHSWTFVSPKRTHAGRSSRHGRTRCDLHPSLQSRGIGRGTAQAA